MNLKKLYRKQFFKRRIFKYDKDEKILAKIFYELYNPKSVLDIGCGIGSYLSQLYEMGCKEILGLDRFMNNASEFVDINIKHRMILADGGQPLPLNKKYDLVLCIEVAEHLPFNNSEQLIKNISEHSNKHIILSAAPPGQRGTGHINCQPRYFWLNLCNNYNIHFNKKETDNLIFIMRKAKTSLNLSKNIMVLNKD